jgi:hypothetical protein
MSTLKIEHPIGDFDTWKTAFERDPVGRKQAGVRRYRVYRPVDDPKYVIIDLDFDGAAAAQAFLESLQKVWSRVDLSPGLAREGGVPKTAPRTRIVEEVESREY